MQFMQISLASMVILAIVSIFLLMKNKNLLSVISIMFFVLSTLALGKSIVDINKRVDSNRTNEPTKNFVQKILGSNTSKEDMNSNPNLAILGAWKELTDNNSYMEFFQDGTAINKSPSGFTHKSPYSFSSNNRIKIESETSTYVATVSFSGDKMTWEGDSGDKVIWQKLK